MSQTNCKNCGGPLDIWAPKCEYCGTRNVNLTSLDLASGEPANFIFRMPHNIRGVNGKEVYLSTLAVPSLETVMMNTEDVTVMGGCCNTQLARVTTRKTLEFELKLNAVHRPDNDTLCELRVSE